jgi:hypothetical protein
MRIVAFPPVGILGWAHQKRFAVRRSRAFFGNGDDALSTLGPARRDITLDLSSLARDRAGAGYLAQLMEEVEGGIHPVRLTLGPTNWRIDAQRQQGLRTAPMDWTSGGGPMAWESGGDPMLWFTGAIRLAAAGTDALGYPTVTIHGVPPGIIIARPDDVIRVFPTADLSAPVTARVVTVARSTSAGSVTIRLRSALPAGVVSIGDSESIVARITSLQSGAQGLRSDWTQAMQLTEVLPAFIPNDAEEVNPWV